MTSRPSAVAAVLGAAGPGMFTIVVVGPGVWSREESGRPAEAVIADGLADFEDALDHSQKPIAVSLLDGAEISRNVWLRAHHGSLECVRLVLGPDGLHVHHSVPRGTEPQPQESAEEESQRLPEDADPLERGQFDCVPVWGRAIPFDL